MTTPTSSAGNSTDKAGSTLLELLVALTILALVASVAAPALKRAIESARLDASARTLVRALRYTRHSARSAHLETTFTIDVETNDYMAADQAGDLKLPASALVTLLTAASEQTDATKGRIRFFADGSSTGGDIVISRFDTERVVAVDWLTGRVELEP